MERDEKLAIEYKGGKCIFCGYSKCVRSLQFHHCDRTKKDFNISAVSYSWERMKIELDKCILVCANCHGEIHDGILNWVSGTEATASDCKSFGQKPTLVRVQPGPH